MGKKRELYEDISISDPVISVKIPCGCSAACEEVYEITDLCLTKTEAIKWAKKRGWVAAQRNGRWCWISPECKTREVSDGM